MRRVDVREIEGLPSAFEPGLASLPPLGPEPWQIEDPRDVKAPTTWRDGEAPLLEPPSVDGGPDLAALVREAGWPCGEGERSPFQVELETPRAVTARVEVRDLTVAAPSIEDLVRAIYAGAA